MLKMSYKAKSFRKKIKIFRSRIHLNWEAA